MLRKTFTIQLKSHLSTIPDSRRPQGKLYDLGQLVLFSILAALSGASSYLKIQRFVYSSS